MTKKKAPNSQALEQKEKWGVPIWTDDKSYPRDSELLSADQWKWEFLRRTEEYRNDWERSKSGALPPSIVKTKFTRPFDKGALASRYGLSHPLPPQQNYKELPTDFHFIRHQESLPGGTIIYPRTPVPDLKRERSEQAPTKKIIGPKKRNGITTEDLKKYTTSMQPFIPHDWYGMRVWVEYDLGYALDTQLKSAEDELFNAQKKLKAFMKKLKPSEDGESYEPQSVGVKKVRGTDKKNSDRKKVELLRVLDAKRSGENHTKIVHGLEALGYKAINESTVSKYYKDALDLWRHL